ncbi:MAG: hypothetical protein NDI90_14245 [Nitrospira sp. BO4]|jgi:hypothetical protein|nr:hypothetical protein [Nitrospira sp. BO4]
MASQLKPIPVCDLCQHVYDPNRGVWLKLREYRACYGGPVESYVFTEAFCDACRVLYATMIGTRKEPEQVHGTLDGVMEASTCESAQTLEYGYA